MSRWLIVGSAGQLGTDLMSLLADSSHAAVGLDRPDIDITDRSSVQAVFADTRPDVVVNAAAYTAVDAAETDEATAMSVNGAGPANLAEAVAELPGTRLVQVSTDYVFDGDAAGPYREDSAPAPRSAYGRTKLAGEAAVLATAPEQSYIVRTAWLYGEHGNNFVKTMLRLEAEKDTIDVVDDQRGQPTWSLDLARQILRLVEADAPAGVYHGTASGATTWYGLTREIYRLIGADPSRVHPVTTDQFPRPAPRPANSVLGHAGWTRVGLEPMRPWDQALALAIERLRRPS